MPVVVIVGAQWGDEGKGKVVDLYTEHADVVARYGGGANAGHTLIVEGRKLVTHHVPSGIVYGCKCILGNGMVIDPKRLVKEELLELNRFGCDISPDKIWISSCAHMVIPTLKLYEKALEEWKGAGKIGTTGRAIGPAYAYKAFRIGIRMEDMLNESGFVKKIFELTNLHNLILKEAFKMPEEDLPKPEEVAAEYLGYAQQLRPYIRDTGHFLRQCLKEGKTVLAEGAQGTLLDVDHGGYPYVTASNTLSGAASTGLGIPPQSIKEVIGVAKVFQTRVGEGPMPTEQKNEIGDLLRGDGANTWDEFGATTGRPRRCGWLDLPLLRYAAALNGMELFLTKLDVLSCFDRIKICVAYEYQNKTVHEYSRDYDLAECVPIYTELPGWKCDIEVMQKARSWEELPANARRFIRFVSEEVVRVKQVSVSPTRSAIACD